MWAVSDRAGRRPDDPPLALILVRNTVSHDNRVLREVQTLRLAGFKVLVAGVVSAAEPERRARVAGVDVVRLDPLAGLRRPRGVGRARPGFGSALGSGGAAGSGAAADSGSAPAVHAGGRAGALRRRLRRLAVTASYNARAAALCRRARPALVHANDYNTMWAALAAKRLCGSRVVYDSHELWADRNGRPEWRPWLIACEALFVRAADVVITASPGYADALARRYRVERPAVVRNIPASASASASASGPGASGPGASGPGASGPGASGPGASGPGVCGDAVADPPLAVYIGGLMPGRGLEPGIEALARVPGLRMALVGPGAESYRARLRALAERAGVADRLELRPAVAPDDVLAAVRGASFGLMLIEPVCRSYELTLPNKLFEYAAAGLPMLSGDLPVIGALVRGGGLGEAVPPDDVQLIADAMRRLIEPAANREARERVRTFASRNTWERERETLAAVYEHARARA